MSHFEPNQQRYIVARLACYASPKLVAKEVMELYELEAEPSIARLMFYDPTRLQGKGLDAELKTLFEEVRAEYKSRKDDIPIATQLGRLTRLQEILDGIERNPVMQAKIIEQAAKEEGGMYTNRRELTGPGGKPLVPDAPARAEAGKELDEWRKQMTEQLSQSLNPPE